MKEKSSTINSIYNKVYFRVLAILLLTAAFLPLSAQETAGTADTVIIVKTLRDTLWMSPIQELRDIRTGPQPTNSYDRRVRRYRRHWAALIPTHTKLQFAGNMGLLSFGFGWDYGKRNQWETDLLFGFVPKYESDKAKATFTLKQNYIPWSLQIKESRFSAEPLACGLYFNTVFGDEFWVSEPERYPKGPLHGQGPYAILRAQHVRSLPHQRRDQPLSASPRLPVAVVRGKDPAALTGVSSFVPLSHLPYLPGYTPVPGQVSVCSRPNTGKQSGNLPSAAGKYRQAVGQLVVCSRATCRL